MKWWINYTTQKQQSLLQEVVLNHLYQIIYNNKTNHANSKHKQDFFGGKHHNLFSWRGQQEVGKILQLWQNVKEFSSNNDKLKKIVLCDEVYPHKTEL